LMDTTRPTWGFYLNYRWRRARDPSIKPLFDAWYRTKARLGYHWTQISRLHWREVLPYFCSRLGSVIQEMQQSRPRKKAKPDRAAHARTRCRSAIQHTYEGALLRHRPGAFHGRMTLIVNEEAYGRNPDLGWSDLVSEGIEIYRARGDHESYIREQVEAVAEQLESILAKSEIDPLGAAGNKSIPQEASTESVEYRLGWGQSIRRRAGLCFRHTRVFHGAGEES